MWLLRNYTDDNCHNGHAIPEVANCWAGCEDGDCYLRTASGRPCTQRGDPINPRTGCITQVGHVIFVNTPAPSEETRRIDTTGAVLCANGEDMRDYQAKRKALQSDD